MMLAACSVNEDNPSGDIPVPTESYETVLNYFKEVNAVPRPSRHEEKMREYLREFAQDRGLRLIEDNGNIIIYKDATTGMENVPMVCLQTHMDMVCVAADGYDIDFLTQGIEQYNDGQFIWSKDRKTSRGRSKAAFHSTNRVSASSAMPSSSSPPNRPGDKPASRASRDVRPTQVPTDEATEEMPNVRSPAQ